MKQKYLWTYYLLYIKPKPNIHTPINSDSFAFLQKKKISNNPLLPCLKHHLSETNAGVSSLDGARGLHRQVFYRQSSPEKNRDHREYKPNCITPTWQEADIKPAVIQLIRERGRKKWRKKSFFMHKTQRDLQSRTGITLCSVIVER